MVSIGVMQVLSIVAVVVLLGLWAAISRRG
jgi:hypothetical protein